MKIKMNASGGGSNESYGTYVNSKNGNKTIPLPFTPSCVSVSMEKAGETYYLLEFKGNNIDKARGQVQSIGAIDTTAGITIGNNQITIEFFSQYLDGYDVYWAAFK